MGSTQARWSPGMLLLVTRGSTVYWRMREDTYQSEITAGLVVAQKGSSPRVQPTPMLLPWAFKDTNSEMDIRSGDQKLTAHTGGLGGSQAPLLSPLPAMHTEPTACSAYTEPTSCSAHTEPTSCTLMLTAHTGGLGGSQALLLSPLPAGAHSEPASCTLWETAIGDCRACISATRHGNLD